MKMRALFTCALLAFSGASFAQSVTVSSSTASTAGGPTTPATTTVTFTSGANPVADFSFRVNYDGTRITGVATAQNGGSCVVNNAGMATAFIVVQPVAGQTALATTNFCNIAFTVAAGAAGSLPLTLSTPPGGGCFDSNANAVNCTLNNGAITVSAGTSPTLTYAPAPNAAFTTVTFPGGAAGTANASITVTPSGSTGGATTTVSGCAITGTGAASFGAITLNPANGVYSTTAGSIGLVCTRAGAAATATLNCNETESDGAPVGPTVRSWGLTCPAAAVNTYTSTAALAFGNQLVATPSANQNVVVTAGAGNLAPQVSITGCAFGGANAADFAFNPAPTFPVAVNAGATVNLPVRFTPAAAGARAATLTCQTANAQNASFVTNLSGTGQAAAAILTPSPAAGALTLPATNVGLTTNATVTWTNTGNASGTVTCAVTGTGFSVNPNTATTIAAPGSQVFTVSASSATPGTLTGTLTCTPSVGAAAVYQLSAVINQAIVQQIPAIGDFGRWALLGLMAGLGAMVAFRKR